MTETEPLRENLVHRPSVLAGPLLLLSLLTMALTLLLVAPATAQQVYALSGDGTMRVLEDPACQPADCRWIDIDRNRRSVSMAATSTGVFQLHDNGQIWVWTGQPCSGGACPHWQRIDRNPLARAIAGTNDDFFQLHSNGSLWRWLGRACEGDRCASWERLSAEPGTIAIAAGGAGLYQLRSDGSIWRWRGEACRGAACWDRLDRNPNTRQIVAAAGQLYQRHADGSIWAWKGRPCAGDVCASWERLDNNRSTKTIVAAPGALYQLHNNGWLWRWKGSPCAGESCPSWERISIHTRTRALAAAEAPTPSDLGPAAGATGAIPVFQVHNNGNVWRWTGQPCLSDDCANWIEITSRGAFTSYDPARGGFFVFGGEAYSGSIAAGLTPADFGYGGMTFARTAERQVEMNFLLVMSTYEDTSFDADQTQAFYENKFFGPGRRIESYFDKNSRDLSIRMNHAGTLRVTDSRTLACAHRWNTFWTEADGTRTVVSCPGDGRSFEMATVEQLESLPADQVRGLERFDRDGDGDLEDDELFVLKLEGLPDRSAANPFDDQGGLKRTLPRCATLQGTGKRLCGDFLPIGDETNFITVVHEIAHLFGTLDIYGNGNNSGYSLMAGTEAETEFYVHIDPWHKMRMGFVTPRIIPIPASTSERQEIRLTHPGNDRDYEPVLFYDQARENEFFMLEFRRQMASSFDYGVAGTGLVIWHVKTDGAFMPVNIASFVRGYPAAQAVAVIGAPNQTIGRGAGWTAADGIISLEWPDGVDSGLRLQVQPFAAGATFLTFQWWRN